MNALRQLTPKHKTAEHNQLTGLTVRLEADRCRCGSEFATIGHDAGLICRSCGRRRGFLSKFRRDWIIAVISKFGRGDITIRGPRL
jgi:hypothetical protein